MEIMIRDATPADASAVAALTRQLANNDEEPSPVTAEYVLSCLVTPGFFILVAEHDRVPVGILSYSVRPSLFHAADCGLIEELVVDEGTRGAGVGKALLAEVFRRGQSDGWAEVSVSTMSDNARALVLYRGLGMTDEAVFLEKHL